MTLILRLISAKSFPSSDGGGGDSLRYDSGTMIFSQLISSDASSQSLFPLHLENEELMIEIIHYTVNW